MAAIGFWHSAAIPIRRFAVFLGGPLLSFCCDSEQYGDEYRRGNAVPSVNNNNNYSLDHPVTAFFSSDDTVAYVLNCGPECGGTQASVQHFNMIDRTHRARRSLVPAASEALVNGSTMYLAGTLMPKAACRSPAPARRPPHKLADYCPSST